MTRPVVSLCPALAAARPLVVAATLMAALVLAACEPVAGSTSPAELSAPQGGPVETAAAPPTDAPPPGIVGKPVRADAADPTSTRPSPEQADESAPTPAADAEDAAVATGASTLTANPGFEAGLDGWDVYVAPSISSAATVETVTGDRVRSGQRALRMVLPAEAQDNQAEYIWAGQYLPLDPGTRYRYSAQVRWANPGNRLPSAIVSAWCRNGDGSYSGLDQWLDDPRPVGEDGGYVPVTFDVTPVGDEPVFCYVALLTHQDGNVDDTEILVDDLTVTPLGAARVDTDDRTGNLLTDPGFDAALAGGGRQPWSVTEWNPVPVSGLVNQIVGRSGDAELRLALPGSSDPNLLNSTWTGRYQAVRLHAGVTYELTAEIDRVVPAGQVPTIVNVYAYKPATSTPEAWLGSVDYRVTRADRHTYRQTFTPTETTDHHITVRVFGWGNSGTPVEVLLDDVSLRVAD